MPPTGQIDKNALEYAYNILARQSYTEYQLRCKLKSKGFEDIEQLVSYLKEKKFIDDRAYTVRYIENRDAFRPVGTYILSRELQKKGIDTATVKMLLDVLERDETILAYEALQKKFKANCPEKVKALRFLASRGFNYEDAKQAFTKFTSHHASDT
jgi:SOS response regulatory protein OraA/RecX